MTKFDLSSLTKRGASAAVDWWRGAKSNPWFYRGLSVGALTLVLDQLSKHWILYGINLPERVAPCAKAAGHMCRQIALSPIFDLTYVENRAASFGIFSGVPGARYILTFIPLIIVGFLIGWLGRLNRWAAAIGCGFVMGGALGNLYDRVSYGFVVDFLDFSGLAFPWVFNVADMAVNVGVGFFLLDAWQTRNDVPGDQANNGASS